MGYEADWIVLLSADEIWMLFGFCAMASVTLLITVQFQVRVTTFDTDSGKAYVFHNVRSTFPMRSRNIKKINAVDNA